MDSMASDKSTYSSSKGSQRCMVVVVPGFRERALDMDVCSQKLGLEVF